MPPSGVSFDHVYRVTTLNEPVSDGEIDELEQELSVPLPIGYREYLTTLGHGELCDLLRVATPGQVRKDLAEQWLRESMVEGVTNGWWNPGVLLPEDMKTAVVFAGSAEGDLYVGCRRFGSQLFELPRHSECICPIADGLWGAVEQSVRRMVHDFPFFEPWDDGRRRHRGFDVRSGLGAFGFIGEIERRWGQGGFRRSRTSPTEMHPNVFVRGIEGRFVMYLEDLRPPKYRLPEGCFSAVASYDVANEDEMSDFVQSVLRPGGESWIK
jgi:hypothetical protein